MGPRPFSHGNLPPPMRHVSQRPRFNGAATFQSRELDQEQLRVLTLNNASMGPRPFSHGNAVHSALIDMLSTSFNGAATFQSREPPVCPAGPCSPCGRFNGAATFQSREPTAIEIVESESYQLQWGRDLSVTGTAVVLASTPNHIVLQWGRDLSVTGTGRAVCNDAERDTALQWGRDLSVTGTSTG